jgi:hypothetical protein
MSILKPPLKKIPRLFKKICMYFFLCTSLHQELEVNFNWNWCDKKVGKILYIL